MHRLDGMRFQFAGVTNITHEHLEYHKTLERYRRAKAILIERTTSKAVLLSSTPTMKDPVRWQSGR